MTTHNDKHGVNTREQKEMDAFRRKLMENGLRIYDENIKIRVPSIPSAKDQAIRVTEGENIFFYKKSGENFNEIVVFHTASPDIEMVIKVINHD